MEQDNILMSFVKYGNPESDSRPRVVKRTGIMYNPKANIKNKLMKELREQVPLEHREYLGNLFLDKEAKYTVELKMIFYVSIPKSSSKKKYEMMVKGEIPIITRPDIDNYMKLLLDALHTVAYDDDKRINKITAEKKYSEIPRTEIDAVISFY
jgi:Holliday junction resolvase RusA-like endonuclease